MTQLSKGQTILRPSAARLLESMRDIGYSFESALADIVDNSISAGATRVDIVNDVDQVHGPFLAVIDDGCGMSSDELERAMQHGSRSPREIRDQSDLGRFGLGLKTASFSQCRRLTVVSRKNGELSARCWDLDLVIAKDEWILKILDEKELHAIPLVERLGAQGTFVLWEHLDRLDDAEGDQDAAYEALNALFGIARPHLALTFHRFIAPEPGDGASKVDIRINGAEVDALDPFARLMVPRSESHAPEVIQMNRGQISVQAFTLPHHQRLSKQQLKSLELGSSLVERQGLYVYRAKRLIAGGTWLGLARRAELTKLLRVRVDVPNSLDTEWSVDVRKSRVRLPASVRARLRPLVERMTESARRPYTYRGTRQTAGVGLPLWSRVTEREKVRYEVNRTHPLVVSILEASKQSIDMEPLLLAIESTIPLDSIFSDIGGDPHQVSQQDVGLDGMERLLAGFVEALAPNSESIPASVAEKILATHVFSGKAEAREILGRLRRIDAD